MLKEQPKSKCITIIKLQKPLEKLDQYQVPEPWSGNLETARILFIGKNPSIDMNEKFPTRRTDPKETERYILNLSKRMTEKKVEYWEAVRKLAAQLLGRKAEPGSDFALTEVVHCKTQGGNGVSKEVRETCGKNYLRDIVELSGATVIVCLGSIAEKGIRAAFGKLLKDEGEGAILGSFQLHGRRRWVASLYHPSAENYNRKHVTEFPPDDLQKLRGVLDLTFKENSDW